MPYLYCKDFDGVLQISCQDAQQLHAIQLNYMNLYQVFLFHTPIVIISPVAH